MKKLLIIVCLAIFLSGCASTATNVAAYRGLTAKQIYNRSEMALAKRQYNAAVKDLQALEAIYPFGKYAQQGQLNIIYAYYKNSDQPSAMAAADRYIRLYPRDPNVAYAYYMAGLIRFHQGQDWLQRWLAVDPAKVDTSYKKQAYISFNQIVSLFPHSRYAPSAAEHMIYIRNILARKNVLIARFYLKRDAYMAAANYASTVVQHYQGAPAVIPALAIMVKAYRAMGLDHLAQNTLRIFAASFPDAKQLKSLQHAHA